MDLGVGLKSVTFVAELAMLWRVCSQRRVGASGRKKLRIGKLKPCFGSAVDALLSLLFPQGLSGDLKYPYLAQLHEKNYI